MIIHGGEIGVMGVYYFFLNGKPVFSEPSKNLITDYGWTRLSNLNVLNNSSTSGGATCQLGASNTAPTTGDTALGALIASKQGFTPGSTVLGTGSDVLGNYSYSRYAFVFPLGGVVGNVAEVGYKVLNADTSLTSRSLVKDAMGNPAVIVVTAADQLTVMYELRYYRSSLDITGSVTVAGVPTTYTLRTGSPVSGTSTSTSQLGGLNPTFTTSVSHYGTGSTLGAPNTGVSGTQLGLTNRAATGLVITVTPTNTVITFSLGPFSTTEGNSSGGVLNAQFQFGDGGSVSLGAYGAIKMNFSPAIPKDSTKTITYSFSFTFTRL